MGKFGDKILNILGVESKLGEFLRPAANYTCASITLGGAGYPIGQFHQQYLAYVEKLDTRQAGLISLINGVWDAFNDPIMGIITDRTKSRYGRHRPYLLFGAIPFAIAYIMRWTSFGLSAGVGADKTGLILYYLIAAIFYSMSYTVMSIPYVSMLPTIAPQYFMRTQYKLVEYMMNSVGQVSSYIFTALALSGFNVRTALTGLPTPSADDRGRYMMVGLILAAWFLWPPMLSAIKTKEPSSLGQVNEPVNWRSLFREYALVFKNRSFRQYFLISLFFSMSRGFYSQTDQYFMVSVADMYKYFISLNIVAGISEFMGSPLNYLLVRYKGKTFCGKLLGPLMVMGLILNVFIGVDTAPKIKTAIIFVSAILYNFGFSGPGFVDDNIQPDVTDVDELITGRRREGVVGTFSNLFRKTVSSVMSYIVGASLKRFGYDPEVKLPSEQSPLTILGLKLDFAVFPSALALLCLIEIWLYTMTKKDHEKIKEVIRQKRETGRVEIDELEKKRIERIAGQKWEDMWIGSPEPVT